MEGRLELNANEVTSLDLDPLKHLDIEQPLDVRIGADVQPVGVVNTVESRVRENRLRPRGFGLAEADRAPGQGLRADSKVVSWTKLSTTHDLGPLEDMGIE